MKIIVALIVATLAFSLVIRADEKFTYGSQDTVVVSVTVTE